MSLYDDLDVPPNASEEEITRAYRKRAQKAHPDRNPGDQKAGERFHALTVAYETLKDPEKRKRYDETGETGVRDERQEAMAEVAGLVLSILEQTDNVDTVNILKLVEASITDTIRKLLNGIEGGRRMIAKRERAMRRFRNKKGQSNVMEAMLRADIEALRKGAVALEEKIAKGHLMLKLLADYEYVVDEAPPPMRGLPPSTYRWRV